MSKDQNNSYDVAIVGAGIAGLFAAWRILQTSGSVPPKIILLERSARVGGRLKTAFIDFAGHKIIVEEGGMRFLKSHSHLMKLIKDLGLKKQVKKFGMGDDNNHYYIRGQSFTRGDVKKSGHKLWKTIYNLSEDEVGKSPFQIVQQVMRKVAKPYENMGGKQGAKSNIWKPEDPFTWTRFRQMKYPKNSKLLIYQWGFRALLEDLGLSNECVQMLMDTGGFSIPYEDMVGAGSGLQLIASFPDNPKFWTLAEGYEELPLLINDKITDLGAKIQLNCGVHTLCRDRKRFQLKTENRFNPIIYADKVILALPATPMKMLLKENTGIRNTKTALAHLEKIVHMPLTKINLYFENDKWWREKGIKNGGCFTDLPLAQVYFFSIKTDDKDRKFTGITIYSDGRRGNYWRQLQELGEDYRHDKKSAEIIAEKGLIVCKKIVVEHALKQLHKMFDREVPAPLFATISKWGDGGLGAGDHQWAVGADDERIRDDLVEIDTNLFLCGEAISDYQDWVEGALRSAERALQKGFKLLPYLTRI